MIPRTYNSIDKLIRELKRGNQVENLASTLKDGRYFISPSSKKAAKNAALRKAKKQARRKAAS